MPPPVPLAYAALAASTVTTLQQLVFPDAWPPAGFHVEIAQQDAGNRDQVQAAAAAGAINVRRAVRRVVLHGTPGAGPVQATEAALQPDPLSTSFHRGGVLLGEPIVVT